MNEMDEENLILDSYTFLAEMVALFRGEPEFATIINRYFAGNKRNWCVGDRADKVMATLRAGYFKR